MSETNRRGYTPDDEAYFTNLDLVERQLVDASRQGDQKLYDTYAADKIALLQESGLDLSNTGPANSLNASMAQDGSIVSDNTSPENPSDKEGCEKKAAILLVTFTAGLGGMVYGAYHLAQFLT